MVGLDLTPLYLSLYISLLTSFFMCIIGIPLAWILSYYRNFIINFLEILIFLPLVLPPTIIGFYILILLNPNTLIGKGWFFIFNSNLLFSTSGLVLSSIIYSLPFFIQPVKIAFNKMHINLINHSMILQFSFFKIFFKVILPFIKNSVITGSILTFSHTLGEFGVILMIGGNIPGKTQVISIAIYESVETFNYILTYKLSILVIILSIFILYFLLKVNKNES